MLGQSTRCCAHPQAPLPVRYTKTRLFPDAHFTPAELIRLRDPLDSGDYVYELKMDGFRALAHVSGDSTRLVSRRGSIYKSFPWLCSAIHSAIGCEAVIDGEIVCLDAHGRPQFYELLRRRGEPIFYAFDVLWCDGEDLRERPLVERKRVLRSVIPAPSTCLLYADHIERTGVEFFRRVCEQDLEGVVAKLRHGVYGERWYKIRNPQYTQYEGRRELFDRRNRGSGRMIPRTIFQLSHLLNLVEIDHLI